MTTQEYEEVKAIRASEIVALANKNFGDVVKYFTKGVVQSEAVRIGLATHSMLLQKDRDVFPKDLWIIEEDSLMTNKAKMARDKAFAMNKTPILRKKYTMIEESIKFCSKILDRYFDPERCEFEKPFFAKDEYFGDIKGRLDAVYDGKIINDLKTTGVFGDLDRHIYNSGYQLQMYIYMELSGLGEANLVFFDVENKLVQVKKLKYKNIKQECDVLLKRAVKNKKLLDVYLAGEMQEISLDEYQIPQWSINELLIEDT